MELDKSALNIAPPLDSFLSGSLIAVLYRGSCWTTVFGVQNIQVMPGIKSFHLHTCDSGGLATKCKEKVQITKQEMDKYLFAWSTRDSIKDMHLCFWNIQLVMGPFFYLLSAPVVHFLLNVYDMNSNMFSKSLKTFLETVWHVNDVKCVHGSPSCWSVGH